MKHDMSRRAFLLFAVLTLFFCLGGKAEETAPQGDVYAILLPADDGFQSVLADDDVPLTDVLDICIAALEDQGNRVLLQGATTNNNSSSLRYQTGTDGAAAAVDWESMPRKGNEATLSSTVGGLNKEGYDQYNRLVIISGQLRNISLQKRTVRSSVPTWLIQLTPFGDGTSLAEDYSKITGIKTSEMPDQNENGFSVFGILTDENETAAEIRYKNMGTYQAFTLLDNLMSETLFDRSNDVTDGAVRIPGTLADQTVLLVIGKDLSEFRMISPDGSPFPVKTGKQAEPDTLVSRELKFGKGQALLIPLRGVAEDGIWKLSGTGHIQYAKLYIGLKDNYGELIKDVPVVTPDFPTEKMEKGSCVFRLSQEPVVQDLTRLFPGIRLKVSDTVSNELVQEKLADPGHPDQVELSFQKGGEHQLTFRLMHGEQEILKQSVTVNVEDKPLTCLLKDGEEFYILHDTLENHLWQKNVQEWFSDPDNDSVSITKIGGESKRIRLDGDILIFQAAENEPDGSEEVLLQAHADTEMVTCRIRISWSSLEKGIKEVLTKCTIEPVETNEKTGKRVMASLRAEMTIGGKSGEAVLNQLAVCEAKVLDESGNVIADAHFDRERKQFVSDPFALPDKQGEYFRELRLTAPEGTLPQWKRTIRSETIKIENHAPETHPEKFDEKNNGLTGEQYLFAADEWGISFPEGLITDPDGDPVTYQISINGTEGDRTGELADLHLPDFGEYDIIVRGFDNEEWIGSPELSFHVSLIDLKDTLQNIQGTVSAEPQKNSYSKREQIKLILKLDDQEWSEKKRSVLREWLSGCSAYVSLNGEELSTASAAFNPDDFTFTAEIQTPDSEKETYFYQIGFRNSESQPVEVNNINAEKTGISVSNSAPALRSGTEVKTEYSAWVMDAGEYDEVTIPADLAEDPDGDGLSRVITLTKGEGPGKKVLEDDNSTDYTLRFDEIGFFTISEKYTAVITYTDNDEQSCGHTVHIELKNQKLLLLIIGTAALTAAAIVILILYLRYRANLPAFSNGIVFVRNGKTEVSPRINLAPWKKLKHLPLKTFAGSITELLDDEQWKKIDSMELRPDRDKGFRLTGNKDKKTSEGEELPYSIGSGLQIRSAQSDQPETERKTRTRT